MKQWRSGPHYVLYEPRALALPRAELFDPDYWKAEGRVEGTAPGRGAVMFVKGGKDGESWALRHYRRGGRVAQLVEDSYLWLGIESARPWREIRLTADLHARGLPVPRPVAAHVRRRGPVYRGDLITERLAAEPLADALMRAPMQPLQWLVLGKILRSFHDAGVCHEDINARNVLKDERGGFHLIDFDKARLLPSGAWQAGNLARFKRSLDKFKAANSRFHFEGVDWQALKSGYDAA
ncbi:MAG: 3-deoxy-D-manno-octulosonic acid kinase [Gammaproteobacteria bacterium]